MFKSIALVFLVAAIAVNAVAIDHFSNENNVVAVLAASAPPPFRLQAWLVTDLGLVLVSPSSSAAALFANRTALWPAAFEAISSRHSVILENGALPAFDDNGDLYFVRAMSADGFNDDYAEEWVLSFRHRTPKPVAVGDEGVPKIVLERRATPVVIQDDGKISPPARFVGFPFGTLMACLSFFLSFFLSSSSSSSCVCVC